MAGGLYFLILFFYEFTLFSPYVLIRAYTLTPSDSIFSGQTLVSQGGNFKLGFFTPSASSKNTYLGIWYNKIPVQTVVWVANRNSPLNDASGVLRISPSGNLVIVVNQTDVVWSSNISVVMENPIAELLESGNLVLRDLRNGDPKNYFWQSFDCPTDTLLPGMKLGWNLKTRTNRYLSSWKKFDDPSHGDYTWGCEFDGYPEFFIWNGRKKYYRVGTWNDLYGSGSPELKPNAKFTYQLIDNVDEKYFTYQLVNHSSLVRLKLTQTSSGGRLLFLAWVYKTNSWVEQVSIPRDFCDEYARCGAYSTCDMMSKEHCQCLEGFKPRLPEDWTVRGGSLGCQHQVSVRCSNGEGFKVYKGLKLPEKASDSWINKSMTLEECRVNCLSTCSCLAFANIDIRHGGTGCIMWFNDLIDMRKLTGTKQALYIRVASSTSDNSKTVKRAVLIVVITLVLGAIAFCSGRICIWLKRNLKGGTVKDDAELPLYSKRDDTELPLFDLVTLISATHNFSNENKLGEGGFGPVYKGILDGEEEIAVKRLSKNSTQGVNEFKNEVTLISKLQHRNLVRILGYCIQGEEKMLVYEYMQNNSLDSYIFDEQKRCLLDWKKRSQIILGIARGLLYLHHDSRLRVIHRDLKASNVLLDGEMVAKISDFGLARIFHGDEIGARTKRVVGTIGYMSPEYAVDGHFSVKSDVFSYGVLILEIISGKRNRGFSHPDHELNLLGHTWRLWIEDKILELVDESLDDLYYVEDISRCIQIGLLCVQKSIQQRPTMSSVVLMLSSESVALPQPQPPGFYIERGTITEGNAFEKDLKISNNDASITTLEAR